MKKNLVVLKFLYTFANSNTVRVVQLVRISDCGPEGRGFKSHLAPRNTEKASSNFEGAFLFLWFCIFFFTFAPLNN